MRSLRLTIALWMALAVVAPARALGDGVRRALLIGIESYAQFGDVWTDLDGPFNDVALVSHVLQQRFDFEGRHVTRLLDATRDQIEQAFEDLIASTQAGDHVYIHYAGHGSRVPDANGDEVAGAYDSTLVPVDARRNPRGEILDDEIALWLHRLRQRTPHVVFVVDACHSGTITRAAEPLKTRGAPTMDDRSYAWSKELDLESLGDLDTERDRFVRLSACLDSQRAKEYRADDGEIFGLFTWNWCQALLESGPQDTYGTVMRRVAARVFRERSNLQHPQLEGRDDALLFAGTVREVPRLLTVLDVDSDTVRLQGGLLQGVAVGSTFVRLREEADTELEITRVDAVSSQARVVAGMVPSPGDLFREEARAQRLPRFRVILEEGTQSLRSALEDSRSFEVVAAPPADALVRASNGEMHILDERGDPYGGRLLDSGLLRSPLAAGPEPIVRALRRCYDLRDVLQVTRSHLDFRRDVTIELVEFAARAGERESGSSWVITHSTPLREDLPSVALPSGTRLDFRIRNESLETLYFYLFNVRPDGSIEQFFPRDRQDSRAEVWSGDTLFSGQPTFYLDEAAVGLLDTYVWFVTREPADLRFLTQDSLVPTRGAVTRVERLAQQLGGRRARGEAAVPLQTGDLATRMISIEVQASSSR